MYWHKVLMIYSFYVYRICIFIPLFITDIYNLCLFFFLINRLRGLLRKRQECINDKYQELMTNVALNIKVHFFLFILNKLTGIETVIKQYIYLYVLKKLPNYYPRFLYYYIIISNAQNFHFFLHSHQYLVITFLFGYSHFSGCIVITHCDFNLHFSNN